MVYIESLNKNIFPYYTKPFEDELFTSWVLRLSMEHGVKPITFLRNFYGDTISIWNRDLDVFNDEIALHHLSANTPLSEVEILNLFLKSYEGIVFQNINEGFTNGQILKLGIKHRHRFLNGLLFCPKCLSKQVYYKKQWRLSISIVCIECQEYLYDECQVCKSGIMFHRLIIDDNRTHLKNTNLALCFNCKSDLSLQISQIKPSLKELEYQRYINSTIELGFNNQSHYSFTYFYVLIKLSYLMYSQRKNNRFRSAVMSYYKLSNIEQKGKNEILLDIKDRRFILPLINSIINNPKVLNEIFELGNIKESYINPEIEYPYWIIREIP